MKWESVWIFLLCIISFRRNWTFVHRHQQNGRIADTFATGQSQRRPYLVHCRIGISFVDQRARHTLRQLLWISSPVRVSPLRSRSHVDRDDGRVPVSGMPFWFHHRMHSDRCRESCNNPFVWIVLAPPSLPSAYFGFQPFSPISERSRSLSPAPRNSPCPCDTLHATAMPSDNWHFCSMYSYNRQLRREYCQFSYSPVHDCTESSNLCLYSMDRSQVLRCTVWMPHGICRFWRVCCLNGMK